MNYKDKILYVLTFLSFSSINFLNVSYSFVKRFIETDFSMTSTEIGIADGLKFFGTIIGLFLYINFDIIKKHKITLFYCVSIILNGVSMGMIPILSIFKENAKWSVFLFNFLGGMTKAPCWPLLLQIVKETIFNEKNIKKNVNEEKSNLFNQENVKNEENFKKNKKSNKSFIVWTSLTLLGNIFGLVIQEQLVYSVNLRWEFCLIVSVVSIIFFSITLGVYYYMSYALSDGEDQLKRNSESFHNDKDASLILKCLEILFLTKNCLFTWSLVLILSIHSVMMMFLPLFLYKLGYHQYEGYILGWYNLCVVFGTIIFTCLDIDRILNVKFLIVPKNEPEFVNEDDIFHDISNDTETEERNEKECEFETANLISLFLLVGTCIFLVTLPCFYSCSEVPFTGEIPPYEINNSYKVIEYFAVIGFFGLFLGGPLNKYESIEFVSVLKEFETNSKEFYHSCESINSDVESLGNQTTKIYIGMVQIFSYLTVMFFLVLAGRIIDTNILSFFYLIGILSAMIFILDVIRIIECKFGNDYE